MDVNTVRFEESPPWREHRARSPPTEICNQSTMRRTRPGRTAIKLATSLILLASLCLLVEANEGSDGLREYRLYHGPCIGAGGTEALVGDVLVKHIGGKSRGKFQAKESSVAHETTCSPGSLSRSRLVDGSGKEYLSSFVTVRYIDFGFLEIPF